MDNEKEYKDIKQIFKKLIWNKNKNELRLITESERSLFSKYSNKSNKNWNKNWSMNKFIIKKSIANLDNKPNLFIKKLEKINNLKQNEFYLNKLFNDIYNYLKDMVTSKVKTLIIRRKSVEYLIIKSQINLKNKLNEEEKKFGKKIKSFYEKSEKTYFIKNLENFHSFSNIINKFYLKEFKKIIINKFENSFDYSLNFFKDDIFIYYHNMIPNLLKLKTCINQKQPLLKAIDIINYKNLIIIQENFFDKVLKNCLLDINESLKIIEKNEKYEITLNIRKRLNNIRKFMCLDLNYKEEHFNEHLFYSLYKKCRNEFSKRIEYKLLDIKIAKAYYYCYNYVKNEEKGFLLLSKSFDQNKHIWDIYLDYYIKYHIMKPLLCHFLKENEVENKPFNKKWKNHSLQEWIYIIKNLAYRNKYLNFFSNYLLEFFDIKEIQKLLILLGKLSYKFGQYEYSEKYYESLLYTYDKIDRLNLTIENNKLNKNKNIEKKERILKTLKLNKNFVKINNKLININQINYNFRNCLVYIANNIFLYNNSVKMINETDPVKYPKKNVNDIILKNLKSYEENIEEKIKYQNFLTFFNKEYKKTIQLQKKLWEKINSFNINISKNLYNTIKNSLNIFNKLNLYNIDNYREFLKLFILKENCNDYSILNFIYNEIGEINKDNNKKDSKPKYFMESYFPKYVGDFQHLEIEYLILERYYLIDAEMRKEIKKQKIIKRYNIPTKNSKKKMGERLSQSQVYCYFDIRNDNKLIWDLFLRRCIYESNSYFKNNDFKEFNILKQVYKNLNFDVYFNIIMNEFTKDQVKMLITCFNRFKKKIKKKLMKKRYEDDKHLSDKKIESYSKFILFKRHKIKDVDHSMFEPIKNFMNRNKIYKKSNIAYSIFTKNKYKSKELGIFEFNTSKFKRIERKNSLNKINENEVFNSKFLDNFGIKFQMKYFYNNSKQNLKENNDLNIITQKYHGKREKGDFYHIYNSIDNINSTKLHFILEEGLVNEKYKIHFKLNNKFISIYFVFLNPVYKLNEVTIELKIDFITNLSDEKEKIILFFKNNFQSYWPILFYIFLYYYMKIFLKNSLEEYKFMDNLDNNLLLELKEKVGLLYPLHFLNLKSYNDLFLKNFNLNFYQKTDLDCIQCFINNLQLWIKILRNLIYRNKIGKVSLNTLNLTVIKDNKVDLNISFIFSILNRSKILKLNYKKFIKNYFKYNLIKTEFKFNYDSIFNINNMKIYIENLKNILKLHKIKNENKNENYEKFIIFTYNYKYNELFYKIYVYAIFYKDISSICNTILEKISLFINNNWIKLDKKYLVCFIWFLITDKILNFQIKIENIWDKIYKKLTKNIEEIKYIEDKFLIDFKLKNKYTKILKSISFFKLIIVKDLKIFENNILKNFDLIEMIKHNYIKIFELWIDIYSNPFKLNKIQNYFINLFQTNFLDNFIYERSKFDELRKNKFGYIDFKFSYNLLKFDYEKFNSLFNNEKLILIENIKKYFVIINRNKLIIISNFKNFFKTLEILILSNELNECLVKKVKDDKINNFLNKIKSNFNLKNILNKSKSNIIKIENNIVGIQNYLNKINNSNLIYGKINKEFNNSENLKLWKIKFEKSIRLGILTVKSFSGNYKDSIKSENYDNILFYDFKINNLNFNINNNQIIRYFYVNLNKNRNTKNNYLNKKCFILKLYFNVVKNNDKQIQIRSLLIKIFYPMKNTNSYITIKNSWIILKFWRIIQLNDKKLISIELYKLIGKIFYLNIPINLKYKFKTYYNYDELNNNDVTILEYEILYNTVKDNNFNIISNENIENSINYFNSLSNNIVRENTNKNKYVIKDIYRMIYSKNTKKLKKIDEEFGFLNIEYQRKLNILKNEIKNINLLSNENIKNRLIINNDTKNFSLKNLTGINTFEHILIDNLSNLGLCNFKINTYFYIDNNIKNYKNKKFHNSLDDNFYNEFAIRIKTLTNIFLIKRKIKLSIKNNVFNKKKYTNPLTFINVVEKEIKTHECDILNNIKKVNKNDYNIFLENEFIFISFNIMPKSSKTKTYKFIINKIDITKLFLLNDFIFFMFKTLDIDKIKYYLNKMSSKHIYIIFLRYFISKLFLTKGYIYRIINIRLSKMLKQAKFIGRNIFYKYETQKNNKIKEYISFLSDCYKTIGHFVKKINKNYFIITIIKNLKINEYEIFIYNTQTKRKFKTNLMKKDLSENIASFLIEILKYICLNDFKIEKYKESSIYNLFKNTNKLLKKSTESSNNRKFLKKNTNLSYADEKNYILAKSLNLDDFDMNLLERKNEFKRKAIDFDNTSFNSKIFSIEDQSIDYDLKDLIEDLKENKSFKILDYLNITEELFNKLNLKEILTIIHEKLFAPEIINLLKRIDENLFMKHYYGLITKVEIKLTEANKKEINKIRTIIKLQEDSLIKLSGILFFEDLIDELDILVDINHNDYYANIKENNIKLKENIINKSFQFNEITEIFIEINLTSPKEKFNENKIDLFNSIQHIEYADTSKYFIELIIYSSIFKISDAELLKTNFSPMKMYNTNFSKFERKFNLRELINLNMTEKSIKTNFNEKKINLYNIYDLSNFMIYNTQKNNLNNISFTNIEKIVIDEEKIKWVEISNFNK